MPQINNVFSRLKRIDSETAKKQMQRNITRAFGRNPDWPQGFRGGIFDGAGASGRFGYIPKGSTSYDYIRNTPIPVETSFSDAYSQARKNGLKTFTFNGKQYNTDYDPNAKLGPRESEITLANLRQVLDENKKEIPDSTRIEPWLGQIPGEHRRNKLLGGNNQVKVDNTRVFKIRPSFTPIFNIPSELALFDAGIMLDEKGNPFLHGRKDYYGKPEYISKEEAIKRAKVGSLGRMRQVEDADSLALAKSAREFAKLLGNGKTLTENISKIPPYYTLGNGRSLFDEAYQSKLGAPRSWYLENENKVKQKLIEQADRIENSKKTFVFGGSKRKKAALGTQYPLIGGVQPLNFTVPTFTPAISISPLNTSGLTGNYRDLFNQNVRAGVLSTAISGLGRLGNYLAINSFKPKMQHTEVQAEQAEKAPTTYSINAQRDNLARSIAQGNRDINNNTASSQVAEARKSILRNRGIGAFNSLYEGKLNRETEMLRGDAQLRQGVRQRNTAALNNAVARDTATNTSVINNTNLMKKQALGNLFTGLSSDSINTINQLGNSYYNLLSNQQQLDRDIATASLYFLANQNAGNLFAPDENGNSVYDNVYGNVRRAWYGKLGGYNSLIRR